MEGLCTCYGDTTFSEGKDEDVPMNSIQKNHPKPPGPPLLPIVGNLELLRNSSPLHLLLRWRHDYGDVMGWRLGPRKGVMVNDPEVIKHVLGTNHQNYTKAQSYNRLKPLLGEGLLTSEGDFWKRQRRLSQPAFHRKQIEKLAGLMVEEAEKLFESWDQRACTGESFDINEDMMRVTLSIVCRALFGTGLTEDEFVQVSEAMEFLLKETIKRAMRPWFVEFPTQTNRKYQSYIHRLNAIVYRIIKERRASAEQRDDLLGMLLSARDEDSGEQMSDEQLRDEAMTLFLAGHETTANALSWTFLTLSRHPTVRAKVCAEIETVLGEELPSAQSVAQLPYTRCVLDETLRLHPPLPSFARRAIEDDTLGGFHLEAGTNVLVCPYVLHRHPKLWPNPEGFDPERFQEEKKKEYHKFAYLPFGGGPRFCIGNNFAIMEALIILTVLCRRYEVNLVPFHNIELELSLSLRPKDGIQVSLTRR